MKCQEIPFSSFLNVPPRKTLSEAKNPGKDRGELFLAFTSSQAHISLLHAPVPFQFLEASEGDFPRALYKSTLYFNRNLDK